MTSWPKDVLQTFLWTFEILRDQVKKDLGMDPSNRIHVQHTHTIHAWNMYLHLVFCFFCPVNVGILSIFPIHACYTTYFTTVVCLTNRSWTTPRCTGAPVPPRHRNPNNLQANLETQNDGPWKSLETVNSFKNMVIIGIYVRFLEWKMCFQSCTTLSFQKLCQGKKQLAKSNDQKRLQPSALNLIEFLSWIVV